MDGFDQWGIRAALAWRRARDLLSLRGSQADGGAGRRWPAVRGAGPTVPDACRGGRHALAHALCAFARWQTIPGEHAQRRSVAHSDHRCVELDGWVKEMMPGTKL